MTTKGAMAYIRKTYGVPAKRGMRARVVVGARLYCEGRITSADGGCIVIDGRYRYHCTWNVVYLNDDGSVLHDTREVTP
jgi:hypothetical protein